MADTKITFEQINGTLNAPFSVTGGFDFNLDSSSITIGNGATAYTIPVADGSAGQYLQTDGAGTVSFVTPAGIVDTNFAANDLTLTGLRVHDFALQNMIWQNVSGFSILGNNGAIIDMNNGDFITINAPARLEIVDSNGSSGTSGQALIADGAGDSTWQSVINSINADNGLSITGNIVELGGTLTKSTFIDGGNFDFDFFNAGSFDVFSNSTMQFNATGNLFIASGTAQVDLNGASVDVKSGALYADNTKTELSAANATRELRIKTPNVITGSAVNNQFLQLVNSVTGEVEFATSTGGSTASNGLTDVGGDIQLGGTLTQTTTVDTDTFNLFLSKVDTAIATVTSQVLVDASPVVSSAATRVGMETADSASSALGFIELGTRVSDSQSEVIIGVKDKSLAGREGRISLQDSEVTLEAQDLPTSGSTVGVKRDGIELGFNNADLKIDTDPGAAGEVLTSNGPGAAPTWGSVGGKFVSTAVGTTGGFLNGVTGYIGRNGAQSTLEGSVSYDWGVDVSVERLGVFISLNTCDQSTVFTMRKNALATAINIIVPAGTTGYFTASATPVTFLPTDNITVQANVTTSTSGSITIAGVEFIGNLL